MFVALYCFMRNLALGVLVLMIFVHEPTFQFLHWSLLQIHIALRHAFLYLRANFADETSINLSLKVWLAQYIRVALRYFAPLLRPVLPWVTRYGTDLVRAYPRYLCTLNNGLVNAAKYLVDVIMEEDGMGMNEAWNAAGEGLAGYCTTAVQTAAQTAPPE
ncbi:hypothetical protein N0V90_004551 [Kalmusia sp. IMI 367209]|nr:hypothetical protein N0V90_004551 [Kalmusia sp. IMI 367209]